MPKKTKRKKHKSSREIELENLKEIKEELKEIKEEVGESKTEVDELKEEIEEEVKHEDLEFKELKEEIEEEVKHEDLEFKEFEREIDSMKFGRRIEDKITLNDLARGVVGSTVGMVSVVWETTLWDIAAKMPWWGVLLIFALSLIGAAFVLNFSQYKKVTDIEVLKKIIPRRTAFFYILSFSIVFGFMLLFRINVFGETSLYVMLSRTVLVTFPAVLLACAADVI